MLELLERRRADDAQIAGREHRLDQRRQIHRAAGRRAGADGRVDFVDEENRLAAARSARVMTALKRSSKSPRKRVPASSAPVSSENTSASFSTLLARRRAAAADGQAFGHRGLADAGLADEHRVVLAAAAQHLDRPLQLLGAADQRIEQPLAGAFGQVDAVRRQRVGRRRRAAGAFVGRAVRRTEAPGRRARRLRDAVRDVVRGCRAG